MEYTPLDSTNGIKKKNSQTCEKSKQIKGGI